MAAQARAGPRKFSRQFWPLLRHAISECCLIIMLVATAVLSYMATRLEISRLSYCQSHNKLACSDDMCDKCLLSCTTSDGKPSNLANLNVKEKVKSRPRSRHKQLCSCCSVRFKKSWNSHKLSEVANSRFPGDDVSKVRSIAMASVGHSSDDSDHLAFEGYRKLKVGHDSESEIHISDSDDDVGHTILHEARGVAIDISSRDVQLQPMISGANSLSMLPSDNTVTTKPKQPLNTARDTDSQSSGTKVAKSLDRAIGHGLDEINWSQINANSSDNNIDMQPKAMPAQVCAEHPKEKTFLVGIEEVGDSFEGVPGSPDEEVMNDFAASANAGTSSSAGTHINRNNSVKNASGSRGYLKSPRLSEIISARDTNSKTNQEVKTFLSQLSARGFDVPINEMTASPRISTQIDEYRQYDATGMAPFLERNNSNLEPFDVNATSEDEGESSIERLKQQAEVNRKKMSMLYKELEAERSASAVAASEAMAMINRLQEEKAGMHMEALQYLRMMEEQADHDQEAIEKLNDLLTEREKELLDLEAELEGYRSRLHDEPFDVGNFSATDGALAFGVLDGSDFMRHTMFDFEDEKAKILDSLHRLEETLGMFSLNRLDLGGTNDTLQNGPLRDHLVSTSQYLQNSEMGTSQMPQEHAISLSVSSPQNNENQYVENQTSSPSCSQLDDAKNCSLTSVKHDISLLNTRFKALEADQNFLKQILSSLNCSSDGVQYIQEITSHLRELRIIMAEQRDMPVL
ncbi:myosin-binding protein 1 isoform X1 [Panicum miliaceum]|uniref:Myosin-binding protein 1 isoform X1 n=1 Tax=Panicum miliaceum TaxID=4540 RepID=A0A3L6TKW4_PANMI|nr:myosin-binding protein 1 isoform X1 [Panicum miliaceum]